MENKSIIKSIFIALLVALLATNMFLFVKVQQISTSGSNNQGENNTVTQQVVSDVKTSAVDAVSQVIDSVVGIQVYNNSSTIGTSQLSGSGSGVIYEVNGNEAYIITNHHVINGANAIEVVFSNGESAEATLVGSDQYNDIALLHLTSDVTMSAIKIGDSSLLDAGETVLAIGCPLGIEYAGTVTQGVVSTANRIISIDVNSDGVDDWEMPVIQTDAAINPGNSGGALVNLAGELVGITSMKLSDTSVEGMGFALPVNEVVRDIEQIKENGKISRPVLGVSGISISDLSAYQLRMYRINTTATSGIYVASVVDGSAAQKAGIQADDVIVGFGDQEITTYKSFITALYEKEPGDEIQIKVNRDGNEITLNAVLGG